MLVARGARRLLSKASTKLVGLDVVPDALPVLRTVCQEQLDALKVLPEGIPYRTDLEKFQAHLLANLDSSSSVADFEAKVGLGEVEEIIDMVKTETALIPKYAAWRAWEEPQGEEADRFLANKQTVLDSLKDRGAAIRRLDIPMREPSVDFPSAAVVDVEPFRPPEEGEAAQTK